MPAWDPSSSQLEEFHRQKAIKLTSDIWKSNSTYIGPTFRLIMMNGVVWNRSINPQLLSSSIYFYFLTLGRKGNEWGILSFFFLSENVQNCIMSMFRPRQKSVWIFSICCHNWVKYCNIGNAIMLPWQPMHAKLFKLFINVHFTLKSINQDSCILAKNK